MINPNDVVKLHTWWLGELQKLTQKVMNEELKRQEKMKTKVYAELDDYKSTLREDPVYRMKINMLQEMYIDSKQVIKDNGG